MTTLTQLTALSPLDGRYHGKVDALRAYFSEFGLIRFRVLIEIEWLKTLSAQSDIPEIASFSSATIAQLDALNTNFSEADAQAIKDIEHTTNHDVKAVEYWLREKLASNPETTNVLEFIHFACTSEDINNLSHALMLKGARDAVMLPTLNVLITRLKNLAHELADLPILAMTASAMGEQEDECLAAGMNDFASKPFDPDQLYAVIAKWVTGGGDTALFVAPDAEAEADLPGQIEGLDIRAGLRRFAGMKDLYIQTLRSFVEKQGDVVLRMRQSIDCGDIDKATRAAHTLKGLAGQIEAGDVVVLAADIEAAMKGANTDLALQLINVLDPKLSPLLVAIQFAVTGGSLENSDGGTAHG